MKTTKLFGFRYVVMGVVGVALLLAACSSGGEAEPPKVNTPTPTPTPAAQQTTAAPTPTPTPTAPPVAGQTSSPSLSAREIKATLKNHIFPKEIRVQAGETVVFVITNEADEKHSFEITDFDFFQEIKAGQTARFEWVVPNKKGKWDMGCYLTVPDEVHEDMEGILIIE